MTSANESTIEARLRRMFSGAFEYMDMMKEELDQNPNILLAVKNVHERSLVKLRQRSKAFKIEKLSAELKAMKEENDLLKIENDNLKEEQARIDFAYHQEAEEVKDELQNTIEENDTLKIELKDAKVLQDAAETKIRQLENEKKELKECVSVLNNIVETMVKREQK